MRTWTLKNIITGAYFHETSNQKMALCLVSTVGKEAWIYVSARCNQSTSLFCTSKSLKKFACRQKRASSIIHRPHRPSFCPNVFFISIHRSKYFTDGTTSLKMFMNAGIQYMSFWSISKQCGCGLPKKGWNVNIHPNDVSQTTLESNESCWKAVKMGVVFHQEMRVRIFAEKCYNK